MRAIYFAVFKVNLNEYRNLELMIEADEHKQKRQSQDCIPQEK